MRIGIITFHCAHNYGAVLQCFALQEYLIKRGHEVFVIDYRPEVITNVYKWFIMRRIIRKNIYKAIKELLLLKGRKRRYNSFNSFIETKLRLAPVETIMSRPYDLIIIGSDQVWNYHITGGFDNYYWGCFSHPKHTKIASYAASMHDNWTENEACQIYTLLKHFYKISVRERLLANNLIQLTGRQDICTVVDPTILLNAQFWERIAIPPKFHYPYLLLFQVEGKNRKSEIIASEMAKRKHLRIIHLFTAPEWGTSKDVVACSPVEFVGLFMNASFVVCSSFHGTIFSLHFRKPFISVKMGEGKDNRVSSLLEILGLSDHFIEKIPSNYDGEYELDERKLDDLRQKSMEYIKRIDR